MGQWDGWEPLRDEKSSSQQKILGSGGQGKVYLVRSPEKACELQAAQDLMIKNLNQIPGGIYDPLQLATAIRTLTETDDDDDLGALKQFQIPEGNSEEKNKAVERLRAEVEALTALRGQQGILQLLAANLDERFIVTQFHRNGTLDKRIECFRGNALAALKAFKSLVNAVCKIHEKGAIHRDIKLENIFVNKDGELVLGDFGIVFFQDGCDRLTSTYERVGSHEWMAPWAYKRSRLDLERVDTRLDIFPLAKVLWCMIAGERSLPFWEYDREDNDLEKLFPKDPLMRKINRELFRSRIVRNEGDCDPSAKKFFTAIEEVLQWATTTIGYRPDGASTWLCRVCGQGEYHTSGLQYMLRAFRNGGPVDSQEIILKASICNHCGHSELFKH